MREFRPKRRGKISISISIDSKLLDKMTELGITNKSQFINDILAEKLEELEELIENEQDRAILRDVLRHPYRAAIELLKA